jgi:hypothetical protein
MVSGEFAVPLAQLVQDAGIGEVAITAVEVMVAPHWSRGQVQVWPLREPAAHGSSDQLPNDWVSELGFDLAR